MPDQRLRAVTAAESTGKVKNSVAGEFWWSYEPVFPDSAWYFKEHAAVYYRKALAGDEVSGLKKTIIEQRLASLSGGSLEVIPKNGGGNEAIPVGVAMENNREAVDDVCVDGDVAHEVRMVDVVRDGGTFWMWTNKDPDMEMDKFSSPDTNVKAMSRGVSPLGKMNLWGREYEGTKWAEGSRDYWVRKELDLDVDPAKLVSGYLSVRFDRNCEIWLNGQEVYSSGDVSWHYHKGQFDVSILRKGKNILAAHVQNDKGNGWFDMGMVVVGNGIRRFTKAHTTKAVPYIRVSMDSILPEQGVIRAGIHGGDEWAYTFIRPASSWKTFEFDDNLWKRGIGGFGGGTAFCLREFRNLSKSVQTKWDGDNIWLRRKVMFEGKPSDVQSALLCIRGHGVKIYFNGELVAKEMDISRCLSVHESDMWDAYDITEQVKKLMKPSGKNIVAVEVKQEDGRNLTYWSRCIDVGLYMNVRDGKKQVTKEDDAVATPVGSVLSGLQSEECVVLDSVKTPYVVEGQYVVTSGKSLTVKKGVTVLFRQGAGILVDSGSFSVEGTVTCPVYFRGERKPAGFWKGIVARSAAGTIMEGAIVSGAECGLMIDDMKSAIVKSCTFTGNVIGVGGHISNTAMSECLLTKNTKDGYRGEDQGFVDFDHCTISDNGGWGVCGPFKFAAGMTASVVRNNREGGYFTGRMGSYSVTPLLITGSIFESNGQAEVKIDNSLSWPCTGNWWGVVMTRELMSKGAGAKFKKIIDARHDAKLGIVDISEFLEKPPKDCGATAYPKAS